MKLKLFLKIASGILAFSALLDYLLWFTIRFHVPSWTIATLSLCLAVILLVLSRFLPSLKVLGSRRLRILPNTFKEGKNLEKARSIMAKHRDRVAIVQLGTWNLMVNHSK